jgi:hypothetical protein
MKLKVIKNLKNRFIETIHRTALFKKFFYCIILLQETKCVHEGLRVYDI